MKKVIIIGSGVAGTILARQILANSDFQIIMFEAGPMFKPGDRRTWLDHLVAPNKLYERFTDDPGSQVGNRYMEVFGARLFMKGGTTNHWGGLSPRFKPEDFELKSRTGYGADWPITYRELAPYYTKAEALLGVCGDSYNDDPPRYGDKFPFYPPSYTLGDGFLIKILEDHKISYGHAAVARNGNKCITTGTCDYCPTNARYTALYDLVQLQMKYEERLSLHTESPVTKILMDGQKRAIGVDFLDLETGNEESMEADSVVISSGTIESAKLLLASANRDWQTGIGNHSDHLGRHLVGHPLMFAEGVRSGNPNKFNSELGFTSLLSRHFDSPEYQSKGKMWFSPKIGSDTTIERGILSNMSRADIDEKMSAEANISIGGEMEMYDSPANLIRLGKGKTRHGLPTTKMDFEIKEITVKTRQEHADTFVKMLKTAGCKENSIQMGVLDPDGAHASGTCRMSHREAEGVVDAHLRIHNTDNLYVCSNAVFPSIAAANPTLTVSALAVRLAEHMTLKNSNS